MSLDRFIAHWTHPDYPPQTVAEENLAKSEARLGARLPEDYRAEILKHGLPRPSAALLEAIVESQLDLRDVGDFLSPEEIFSVTKEWRDLGLPDELFAFAADGAGNLFCFPLGPEAERPVIFWNHDDGHHELIAGSFKEWIEAFDQLMRR